MGYSSALKPEMWEGTHSYGLSLGTRSYWSHLGGRLSKPLAKTVGPALIPSLHPERPWWPPSQMSPSLYPLSSHLLASLGQTSGWGWRGFGTPGYSRRKGLSWREEKIFKKNVKNLKPDHHCKVATWHKTGFTVTRLCPSILPYLLLINSPEPVSPRMEFYILVCYKFFFSISHI